MAFTAEKLRDLWGQSKGYVAAPSSSIEARTRVQARLNEISASLQTLTRVVGEIVPEEYEVKDYFRHATKPPDQIVSHEIQVVTPGKLIVTVAGIKRPFLGASLFIYRGDGSWQPFDSVSRMPQLDEQEFMIQAVRIMRAKNIPVRHATP